MTYSSRYLAGIVIVGVLAGLAVPSPTAAQGEKDAPQADPAAEMYYSANAMYNRRLYDLAAKEYKAFLATYPKHAKAAQAELGLALSLYAAGDFAAAEPLLAKSGKAIKGAVIEQVGVLHGQCLLKLNRPADAEEVYAAAAKVNKGKSLADALVGVTEARFQQEKWAAVIESAAALLTASPDNPNASRVKFQGGVARYRLSQFAEAAGVLEQLTGAAVPALAHQAKFLLAECRRELGELDKAAEQYAAAAADKGAVFAAEATYRLGFVRFTQQNYDEAAKHLKAYLDANPDTALAPRAKLYLGQAYLEKADYKNAEALLKPLAEAAKPEIEAVIWLARTYSRQKRMADAAAVLERGLPIAAGSANLPGMLFDLGHARLALEKFPEAAQAFGRIGAEFADWEQAAEALQLKSLAQHRSGDYAGSLASCTAFLGKHKKHARAADVAFMQAENLLLLKQDEKAVKAYETFLAGNADHASANAAGFRVAQLQHKLQQWDAALAQALPLAKAKPAGALFDQLHFLIGDCYFNTEKWAEAVANLKPFVDAQAKAPNRDVALLKLGLAYSRQDQTAEAVKTLTALAAAFADSPQRPIGLIELGRLQYEAKQYPDARKSFTAVTTAKGVQSTSLAQAEYYLGWIDLAEGKDSDAGTHFGALIEKHADSPLVTDALLQLGTIQLKAETYPLAETTLARLVKDSPKYGKADHALYYLGVAVTRQDKWKEAAGHFEAVVEKHPTSDLRDRALYEGAWCAKRLDDAKGATQKYKDLLAGFPQSELAHRATFELAELEFEAQAYDNAIERLNKLLPTLKDKAIKEQALYRLGWCHFSKEDAAKSAASFEALLTEFPATRFLAPASYQAGEARMQLKEHAAARAHFEKAAGNPAEKEVHELSLLRLGETRALTAQWPQSEQAYQSLLTTYPQSQWTRRSQLGLGWALENQQKHAPAIVAYTKVTAGTKRDETSARCQFQTGECLFALKKYDEAIQALIKVSVAYGYPQWSSKALLETGRALEQQAKPDRAREQYEEVIADYPETDAATVAKKRLAALAAGK